MAADTSPEKLPVEKPVSSDGDNMSEMPESDQDVRNEAQLHEAELRLQYDAAYAVFLERTRGTVWVPSPTIRDGDDT